MSANFIPQGVEYIRYLPEILLTITFGGLQVEPGMLLIHGSLSMSRAASIADQHITHE